MQGPSLSSRDIHGNNFSSRLSRTQGYSATGRIMSMKNSSDTVGNRTRDIPACSAVPQPAALPRAPLNDEWEGEFIFTSGLDGKPLCRMCSGQLKNVIRSGIMIQNIRIRLKGKWKMWHETTRLQHSSAPKSKIDQLPTVPRGKGVDCGAFGLEKVFPNFTDFERKYTRKCRSVSRLRTSANKSDRWWKLSKTAEITIKEWCSPHSSSLCNNLTLNINSVAGGGVGWGGVGDGESQNCDMTRREFHKW